MKKNKYIFIILCIIILFKSCVGIMKNTNEKYGVFVTDLLIPPFNAGFMSSYVKIVIIDVEGKTDFFYIPYTSNVNIPEILKIYDFTYYFDDITGWIDGENNLVQKAKIIINFEPRNINPEVSEN